MEWTQIAAQMPVVAVFVGYVVWNNKMWHSYLRERNGKLEKTIQSFEQALTDVSEKHAQSNKILLRFLTKMDGKKDDIEELMN